MPTRLTLKFDEVVDWKESSNKPTIKVLKFFSSKKIKL